ncbi:MAG TPA: hypothetical protein PKE63_09230 [Lacibacter sp.]|nr:hypothetical protein [Lacibacter sp.]
MLLFLTGILLAAGEVACTNGESAAPPESGGTANLAVPTDTTPAAKGLDTALYNRNLERMANGDESGRWPVRGPYPLEGAVLPFYRVVAFYGNFYCTGMGILGEFPPPVVLQKLRAQVREWEKADTLTPVLPAVHYIAVTAQSSPCDGTYRARMPEKEIRKAMAMADSLGGLCFLDVQVGLSTLQQELPRLLPYLRSAHVHLGIDPEFSMKSGQRPGTVIGSFDAADINYVTGVLATLVKENQLPPKILVVHRFTQAMLTNSRNILTRPEVQVVINMDGFGSPDLKRSSYLHFVSRQPVQFTGFKVFYKNDAKSGGRIMSPAEMLQLKPRPVYIQYQ